MRPLLNVAVSFLSRCGWEGLGEMECLIGRYDRLFDSAPDRRCAVVSVTRTTVRKVIPGQERSSGMRVRCSLAEAGRRA